jgi:hypothetical protein
MFNVSFLLILIFRANLHRIASFILDACFQQLCPTFTNIFISNKTGEIIFWRKMRGFYYVLYKRERFNGVFVGITKYNERRIILLHFINNLHAI